METINDCLKKIAKAQELLIDFMNEVEDIDNRIIDSCKLLEGAISCLTQPS